MSRNEDDALSKRRSFLMFFDYLQYFEMMTTEEVGEVVLALFAFVIDGEETEFEDRTLKLAYQVMRNNAIRQAEKYQEQCEKNRENGKKGGRGHKKSDPDDEDDADQAEIDRNAQLLSVYGRIDEERKRL